MTENIVNMDENTTAAEEKTYTQAEVDNIVKSRLAREKSKNKSFKTEDNGADFSQSHDDRMGSVIKDDCAWFEENFGGDFEKFLRSEEFNDFMDGTNMTVRTGMEKFVKLKGADAVKTAFAKDDEGTNSPASAGSVKDSGSSDFKEYYSPEDVDRLTEADLNNPEIMNRVRISMTKWK